MSDADIERSLQTLTDEAGDDPHKTRHIEVGSGVVTAVGPWLAQQGVGQTDLVLSDPNTHRAAAAKLVDHLRAAGRNVVSHVVEPEQGHDDVVCDEDSVARAAEVLRAHPDANAIAVGAGTINDIVKMASFQQGRPYSCVATAASMNGYTSAIAAVLARGVKRTLPAQQAQAVFADIDIIRSAPSYLNQAGFGDLLSKPCSHADWLLSHLVRDVPYQERPAKLLDEAYDALLQQAASVGASEPQGIGTLTKTILLSGFTMAIAGTSSPASGGEHLVSHYWDMEQHCRHLPLLGLHGTQVGVATRISAMLFERLLALHASELSTEPTGGPDDSLESLRALHPRLTPEVVEEVRDQLRAKQKRGSELSAELRHVQARWPEIQSRLGDVVTPSATLSKALTQAGAADRPSKLGIDKARATHTVTVCRQIRSRYVALDLMDDLGLLSRWAKEVVAEVEGQ